MSGPESTGDGIAKWIRDARKEGYEQGLREAADLFTFHPWTWNAKEIRAKILALIPKDGEKP